MTPAAVQINLQQNLGGGEVYTASLCRALSCLGVPTRLLVHARAAFWRGLDLPDDTVLVAVADGAAAAAALPETALWLIGHGSVPPEVMIARRGRLATAVAHMPVQDQGAAALAGHDRVFAVSGWVLEGLRQAGLPAWETPLYGVADLAPRGRGTDLVRNSRYAWDRRKFRDRLFGRLEPWVEAWRSRTPYERRPGLTLGIVSRLTPIKQYPELLALLAPVLARAPDVHLEIFGSGGYSSVRDLRRALAPLRGRVRFWGHQDNVRAAYAGIDYLLTGLPEKEALGLNVIEAQACGTPVVAPDAPPFTETVADGATGFLYRDPRQDGAADFARVLDKLRCLPSRPDPRLAEAHLARFSFDAFVERLRPVVAWAQAAAGWGIR